MMNPEAKKSEKRQVTLEDLLRLKRAERPAPEFWSRFEQELRAKQLAAIVAKRPWWRTFPELFAGKRRYHLPLGATAVLAVTFLSLRQHQSNTPPAVLPAPVAEQIQVASANPNGAVANMDSALVAISLPDSIVSQPIDSTPTGIVAVVNASAVDSAQPMRADAAESDSLSKMVSWLATGEQGDSSALSPAAQSIAANLAAAEEAHPELTRRLYGSSGGFEKRGLPSTRRPAVDPLAQMRSPSDFHRARVLASALPVAARASGPGSERIAGRIADERLTEQEISRFGARGDRFLVKF